MRANSLYHHVYWKFNVYYEVYREDYFRSEVHSPATFLNRKPY